MPITGINHVNIRTLDPAASAQFYVDVLGFDYRRGPVVMGNQGHWLYDDAGNPIIHLRVREPDAETTGPVDHVALTCRDLSAMTARLEARGVKFAVAKLTPGLTQVVLKDPHGIALELSFADES